MAIVVELERGDTVELNANTLESQAVLHSDSTGILFPEMN
jgi:hypothetical protein